MLIAWVANFVIGTARTTVVLAYLFLCTSLFVFVFREEFAWALMEISSWFASPNGPENPGQAPLKLYWNERQLYMLGLAKKLLQFIAGGFVLSILFGTMLTLSGIHQEVRLLRLHVTKRENKRLSPYDKTPPNL